MSSVQERNSEMVNLLSPDFVSKKDSVYLNGMIAGTILSLPGLVSYWPMSVSVDHNTTVFADKVMIGSSEEPDYSLHIVGDNSTKFSLIKLENTQVGGHSWWLYSGADGIAATFGIYDQTAGAYRLIIDADGDVGIGEAATPTYRLDVLETTGTQNIARFGQSGVSNGLTVVTDGSTVTVDVVGNLTVTSGRIGEAWTNVTYNTGWGTFSANYHAVSYKKVGDLVFVRGLAIRSSGSSMTIATLPSGYRPSKQVTMTVSSNYAHADIDIDTLGNLLLIGGSPTVWVTLDGIVFSTL